MPAYNAEKYISQAIESVLQQTYGNWELIIVDDGSSDNTASIAKKFAAQDERVNYIYQENGKQAKARNQGIAKAKGTLVAFLDADDLWKPVKLETQLSFINHSGADLVFADVDVIDEHGNKIRDTWHVQDGQYKNDEGLLAFLKDNLAPVLTVMVKKTALEKIKGFNESVAVQYVEDYDLWLRMLQAGFVLAASSGKLATYRQTINPQVSRKKSIINVVEIVKDVDVKDESLKASRNNALIMWMRKCVQRCRPVIETKDIKKIIRLFPSGKDRKLFSLLSNVLPGNVLAKLLLLYTRKAVYQQ